MLLHHLKVFIRNFKKRMIFSIIIIGGLSLAVAGSLLLFLFVNHELSYDNFHDDADKIYNIITLEKNERTHKKIALSMPQFAPVLRNVPGIKSACKIFASWDHEISYNNHRYSVDKILYTDSGFAKVFSFNVVRGNLTNTLSGVNSLAVTSSFAKKLFGKENPIGKQLLLNGKLFSVETLMEDVPSNSTIEFEVLVPLSTVAWLDALKSNEAYTFFRIDKKANREVALSNAQQACGNLLKTREKVGYFASPSIRSLLDIHLYEEETFYEFPTLGKMTTVYVLAALALFILLIAVLNFINIFISQSSDRIKEIGLRKTIGGSKYALMIQFLTESTLTAIIASVIGAITAILLLDKFDNLMNREIVINQAVILRSALALLGITFSIGLIAGFYPALYVSRFTPSKIFHGKLNAGRKNKLMSGTVVVQFTIVVTMVCLVIILISQLTYMKNKNLGFNKEQVLVFDYNDYKSYETFRSRLLKNPQIINITASQSVPGQITSGQIASIEGSPDKGSIPIFECRTQNYFVDTYQMKLIRGRDFDADLASDVNSLLINETAVKQLGLTLDNAVGARIDYGRGFQSIIGVVKDYHFFSLHKNIDPLMLSRHSKYSGYVSARLKPDNISGTISFIKQTLNDFAPQVPFTYFFIDESFSQMYKKEEAENTLLQFSTFIVIFLAVIGLIALTSIATSKRTKEIGVRKVLGAKASGLIILLSGNTLKYVVLANLIAWPLAWYIGSRWLETFAYRISLNPWYFFYAAFLSFLIALISISIITFRKAFANPVESLRYE